MDESLISENISKLSGLDAPKLLLSLFENYHEGVMITDSKGNMIYFNKALAKLDGLENQNVLGRPITEIYRLNTSQSTTMRAINLAKPVVNRRYTYRTADGKLVNSVSSAYPLFEQNNVVGAVCTVTDYTTLIDNFPSAETIGKSAPIDERKCSPVSFDNLIGQDANLLAAVDIARRTANTNSAMMLAGEPGTGKELFARAIHNESSRRQEPFMAINCAAIPSTLLEGVLFGTSQGAFTGAVDKAGLFELVGRGTIFLDELNSMPLELQPKLLRVLQDQKLRRIGSNLDVPITAKVVSAITGSPFAAIEQGTLRSDLFYRLGVVLVHLPPLRERRCDISPLLNYFREKVNQRLGKNVLRFSSETTDMLETYHWPGNVRELEHAVEATISLMNESDETVEFQHIKSILPQFGLHSLIGGSDFFQPNSLGQSQNFNQASGSLAQSDDIFAAEISRLEDTLRRNRGNVARSARELGYSPQRLHYRLKKFGLNSADFK